MYIYICMYRCILYMCTCICRCTCIYIYIYVKSIWLYVSLSLSLHRHLRDCMYDVYIHIYIHMCPLWGRVSSCCWYTCWENASADISEAVSTEQANPIRKSGSEKKNMSFPLKVLINHFPKKTWKFTFKHIQTSYIYNIIHTWSHVYLQDFAKIQDFNL